MKANFSNSFAKRSLVIAGAALPSLYAGLANAQAAPPPPAVAAAPAVAAPAVVAPAPPPPAAPVAAPTPEAAPAPAVVAPPAPDVPPAPPTVPPPDPDAEKYKHINMGVWMRVDATLQNAANPKKLNEIGSTGEVEFHFSNQMRKYLQWTANLVATYGAGDGDGAGTAGILDLIAQFEPDPAFNVWVGRMLVPTDRSNFSGPYFMGPWHYPGIGNNAPKEGPFGRNNGATAWGQFAGGLFKYYLGVFKLNDPAAKPLVSGRLNLSLLSPEPGFYNSSTYYGKDILALGVGFQYQKNGDAGAAGPPATPAADYSMFNADLLFEKDLKESGVVDVEGALYKYFGDNESQKLAHFVLASYLTPEVAGIGKFQPLVRVQQSIPKTGDTTTVLDAQVGYVVDSYSTRFALGYTHVTAGGESASNAVFAGVQLQK
jgi:hypothetical protein